MILSNIITILIIIFMILFVVATFILSENKEELWGDLIDVEKQNSLKNRK